jgi:hypothetical protein
MAHRRKGSHESGDLALGSFIRTHLSAVRAGIVKASAPTARENPNASSRSALTEMVELLLKRAVRGLSHNRLIEHFNATVPSVGALEQFAALMIGASPVVIVETDIPFVEETIAEIVCACANTAQPLRVCRAVANGDDAPISFDLSGEGPTLVLIPLQVYRSVAQVDRLAFEIATKDLAVIIACERFMQLPECLRRIKDIVLRLSAIDPATFEVLSVLFILPR